MIWYYHHVIFNHFAMDEQVQIKRPSDLFQFDQPLLISCTGQSSWKKGGGFSRPAATTEEFGLEYVLEGDALVTVHGKSNRIPAGSVFTFIGGSPVSYETGSSGVLVKRFVTMNGPALLPILRSTGLLSSPVFVPKRPKVLIELMIRADELMKGSGIDAELEICGIAMKLLMEAAYSAESRIPEQTARLLRYIEKHLHEPLGLTGLSEKLGISTTQLNRISQQYTGTSLMSYIRGQRLRWAKEMLTGSNLTIKEIALTTGFSDALYFSSRFKKHFGLSPTAYRRAIRHPGAI